MKKNLVQKIMTLALAGTMMVSLAACGGTASSSKPATSSAASAKTDSSAAESKAPDSSVAESKAPDSSAAESKAPDSSAAESTTPDSLVSGTPLMGGWSAVISQEDEDAAKKALEKAIDGLAGAEYEYAGLIGRQIVAGTNYLILTRVTPVTPDAKPDILVAKVYEDLEGNAAITESMVLYKGDSDAEIANDGALSLDAEENAALKAAFETEIAKLETTDKLTPIAVTMKNVQNEDRTDYYVLCRLNDADMQNVTVYLKADGTAEIHMNAASPISDLSEALDRQSAESSPASVSENAAE